MATRSKWQKALFISPAESLGLSSIVMQKDYSKWDLLEIKHTEMVLFLYILYGIYHSLGIAISFATSYLVRAKFQFFGSSISGFNWKYRLP